MSTKQGSPVSAEATPETIGYRVHLRAWDDGSCRSGQELLVYRDERCIRTESDGGEPEDQSFYRDWKWVPKALLEAYAFGLEDGRLRTAEATALPDNRTDLECAKEWLFHALHGKAHHTEEASLAEAFGAARERGRQDAQRRPEAHPKLLCGSPSPLLSDEGGCQRANGHDGDHTHWHPTSGGSSSWPNRRRESPRKGLPCPLTPAAPIAFDPDHYDLVEPSSGQAALIGKLEDVVQAARDVLLHARNTDFADAGVPSRTLRTLRDAIHALPPRTHEESEC